MFLLFAFLSPSGLLAQPTNTISGSLINAPGSSSQAIPSRDVVMDFFGSAPATSYSDATNASNDYSISYPGGGPIFAHDNARVYVDLGAANNPVVDVSTLCFSSNDITILSDHLSPGTTLTNLQRIAADVNMDGSLTLADKIMMDSVLLGYYSRFTNALTVGSSTYSDRTIVYPTTSEVSSMGTTISYDCTYDFGTFNIPSGTNSGYDFYSIRLGDLDGNCGTYNGFNNHDGSGAISQRGLGSTNTHIFEDIQISPNPFISEINILSKITELKTVVLLDIRGREIVRKESDTTNTLKLSSSAITNIPNGTYLLRLEDKNGRITTKKLFKK